MLLIPPYWPFYFYNRKRQAVYGFAVPRHKSHSSAFLPVCFLLFPGACNGFCGTCLFTFSTADTFRRIGHCAGTDVHFADPFTFSAPDTFVRIHLVAVEAYGIKNGIERSQGTQPPAEGPENQQGQHHNHGQYPHLPGKQKTDGIPQRLIQKKQRDAALQGSRRADIFTEIGC